MPLLGYNMRVITKRCGNCQVKYKYQSSGQEEWAFNHERYCPGCYEAVINALAKIPPKFERVWVETTEVTLAQLLNWEAAANRKIEERRAQGQIIATRVNFPMFDLSTGTTDRSGFVRGEDAFAGRNYEYRFWPGQENEAIIRIEMEKDLETGALRPW